MGDAVLQDVASAMRKILRETDILARTGGEEFAMALPETDAPGTKELAERVLESNSTSLSWSANSETCSKITASIGSAHISVKNISNWQRDRRHVPLKASQIPTRRKPIFPIFWTVFTPKRIRPCMLPREKAAVKFLRSRDIDRRGHSSSRLLRNHYRRTVKLKYSLFLTPKRKDILVYSYSVSYPY